MLVEINTLFIKNQDKPNLTILSFASLIMNDKYLINESKIFYMNEKKPYMNGLLDMEDLSEIKDDGGRELKPKTYANGPFKIKGSDEFVVIYQYG
jgi:hypothetical protein